MPLDIHQWYSQNFTSQNLQLYIRDKYSSIFYMILDYKPHFNISIILCPSRIYYPEPFSYCCPKGLSWPDLSGFIVTRGCNPCSFIVIPFHFLTITSFNFDVKFYFWSRIKESNPVPDFTRVHIIQLNAYTAFIYVTFYYYFLLLYNYQLNYDNLDIIMKDFLLYY